eukprot:1159373-Pelagomonas_calceolata.AAC.2
MQPAQSAQVLKPAQSAQELRTVTPEPLCKHLYRELPLGDDFLLLPAPVHKAHPGAPGDGHGVIKPEAQGPATSVRCNALFQ